MSNKKPPVPEYVRAMDVMLKSMRKHIRYMRQLGMNHHVYNMEGYRVDIRRWPNAPEIGKQQEDNLIEHRHRGQSRPASETGGGNRNVKGREVKQER